jgi:hypothetical protein
MFFKLVRRYSEFEATVSPGSHDGVWVAITCFAVISIACLVSLFCPKWDIRWGGRHGRTPHQDKPRLSPAGRFGFAIVFGYGAVIGYVGQYHFDLLPWLFAPYIVIFTGMVLIYRYDWRNHLNRKRGSD